MIKRSSEIIATWFPEIYVGGFTSLDGTIEFYTRINALLDTQNIILDFGAGRGAGFISDASDYRRQLRKLRDKVAKVVACDVDEVVLENSSADETIVIKSGMSLPFANDTFDLIISDFVFEHITDPSLISGELSRVLKSGGWLCARTPNKYCPISLVTRLIENSRHSNILSFVQPEREPIDVFPTVFKLNSKRDISRWFPDDTFDDFTYRYEAEPSYFFNSRFIFTIMLAINWLMPKFLKSGLFIFLRKK